MRCLVHNHRTNVVVTPARSTAADSLGNEGAIAADLLGNEVAVTVPQPETRSRRTPRRSAMSHAAIDPGGKESQICIRRQDGTIVEERKVPTRKLTELVAPSPDPRRSTRSPRLYVLVLCRQSPAVLPESPRCGSSRQHAGASPSCQNNGGRRRHDRGERTSGAGWRCYVARPVAVKRAARCMGLGSRWVLEAGLVADRLAARCRPAGSRRTTIAG